MNALKKSGNSISTQGAEFGIKLLTAIAAWVVGRWLISLAVRLILARYSSAVTDSMPRCRNTCSPSPRC